MRRWASLGVVAALLGSGVGSACLLRVDPSIACGDGYVDRVAGEACDPLVASSFEGRCQSTDRPQGVASACDPITCQVLAGIQECGVCGDGFIDAELEETCEPNLPIPQSCAEAGTVVCDPDTCQLDFSGCEVCGNGILEPSEECDPSMRDPDDPALALEQPCDGMQVPGLPELHYTYGTLTCRSDCTWDLTGCGLCTNGELDEFEILDPDTGLRLRPREVCDGERFNLAAVRSECGPICQSDLPGLSCNLECDLGCLGMTVATPEDPGCCLLPGATRPPGPIPCCCELDGPGACGPMEAPPRGADATCPFPIG